MAEIGSVLRETRIREKIDITEVERATKIRAKYLRALETEEWDVLPGPAYVKSFLRTYAEFLGLDAHMLVEDYRVRFEEPEDLELPAFAPDRPLRGRVRPPGPPPRSVAIAVLALALIAVLFVLGITAGDENGGDGSSSRSTRTEARAKPSEPSAAPARPRRVSLAVVAERNVWVCLVDARGNERIAGETLVAGDRRGPFRSGRFQIRVGNGGARLRVNGEREALPETSVPQNYRVTARGAKLLPQSTGPACEGAAP